MRGTVVLLTILTTGLVLVAALSCASLNKDEAARKRIIEAIKADPRLSVEELTITVIDGNARITGKVGSRLHPAIITEILEKLKKEGVIKGYRNDVTVEEEENPLFQDFTVPYF